MLDEGTTGGTPLQISDQLAQLGANLGTGSKLDVSSVSLEALKENLDASLDIYGDVILHPSFPRHDFERLKKQRLAQIQQEKADPVGLALRVFPRTALRAGPRLRQPLDRLGHRGVHEPGSSGMIWSAFTRPGSSRTMPR